jgi:ParB-like chromosome segregation protein Spo0J
MMCRSSRSKSPTAQRSKSRSSKTQRSDLNAMEEAQGYHALATEYKHSAEDIAKLVGKSRSHVANMMRLTRLPDQVQAYIAEGKLSAGHARALINLPDPAAAAKRIVEEGLNVRQTEALAHEEGVPERKPQKTRGAATAKDLTPLRLKSASAMCSGSRSASIIAILAAQCRSSTRIWISSTRFCAVSKRARRLAPPPRIHGNSQQRALTDNFGQR